MNIAELEVLLAANYAPLMTGLTAADAALEAFSRRQFAGPVVSIPSLSVVMAEVASLKAELASLRGNTTVRVTVDTSAANSQLAALQSRLSNLNGTASVGTAGPPGARGGSGNTSGGDGMRNIAAGAVLSTVFTVPLVLGSKAAIQFAGDYQKAMLTAVSTTDLGRQNLGMLSREILAFNNDALLSKGPKDYADGLALVASKGLQASESLKVLKASGYGNSAGLGEIKVIGKTVTDVMSAYGESADKALHITDVITQSVKFGAGEVTQYASAFSKVIPLASQLGISFEEVGANIAQATKIGLTPSEAVTGLRQALSNIIKPSAAATQAFKELKTSRTELLASLQNKGIGATFEDLAKASKGDITPITAIFGSIRGLTEFLATSGKSTLQDYQKTLNAVLHPDGATLAAARTNAEGFNFQLDKLKATAQVAAIEIGTNLIPRLNEFVKLVGQDVPVGLRAWDSLPSSVKTVTLVFAGLLGLAGPLTSFVGLLKLMAEYGSKLGALTGLGALFGEGGALASFGAAGASAATLGIVLGTLAVAYELLGSHVYNTKAAMDDAKTSQDNAARSAENYQRIIARAMEVTANSSTRGGLKKLADDAKGAETNATKLLAVIREAVAEKHAASIDAKLDPGARSVVENELQKLINDLSARAIELKVNLVDVHAAQTGTTSPGQQFATEEDRWKSRAARAGVNWPSNVAPATSQSLFDKMTGTPPHSNSDEVQAAQNARAQAIQSIKTWEQQNLHAASATKAQSKAVSEQVAAVQSLTRAQLQNEKTRLDNYATKNGGFGMGSAEEIRYRDVTKELAARHEKALKAQSMANASASEDAAKLAAIQAENDRRALEAQQQSLGERARMWDQFAGVVEGSLGRIRQLEEQGGQTGEKTAKARVEAELLKRVYDGIPQPLKDSMVALAGIEFQMQRMLTMRDGFRELFNSIFGQLSGSARGQFAQFASQFEQQLGQGAQWNALQGRRDSLAFSLVGTSEANRASLKSQQEQITESMRKSSGVYGDAPLGGAVASGNAKSLFEKFNLASKVDQTCADVASHTVEALGFHLKKTASAAGLERNVKDAGWQRVDPLTAPEGALVFKYSASARSRTHAMMSLGGGRLASSSDHEVSYFNARGNERAYYPAGGATSKVAIQVAATPGIQIRTPSSVNLPGGISLDTRLLTAANLPGAWGGSMHDYVPRPGESTAIRTQVEQFLTPYYSQLAAARRDLAIGSRAGRGGIPLSPEFMAQLGADRNTARTLGPLFTDAALKRDRSQFGADDFDVSTKQVADHARGAIRDMGQKIRLAAERDNPYAALLDGFKFGENQFASSSTKKALSEMTLGSMVSDARAGVRNFRREVSNEVNANRSTAGILTGGNFNQNAYDRELFKTQKGNEIWNSDTIQNLFKAGKGLEGIRLGLMQIDLAMSQFDSDKHQGNLLFFAQTMQQQGNSNSLLSKEIELLKQGAASRSEVNDQLEVERTRREALLRLAGEPDAQAKANAIAAGKRSELLRGHIADALTGQSDYERQRDATLDTLNGTRQFNSLYAPDSPERAVQIARLQKLQELTEQQFNDPTKSVDIGGRLADFEKQFRLQQQIDRETESQNKVIEAQNTILDSQGQRQEALVFTAKARLDIEMQIEATKRANDAARGKVETAAEAAARARVDAERQATAAQADRLEKLKSQASDVQDAFKSLFSGDFKSPFSKIKDEILSSASGSLTNRIFGENAVDARPTGFLDMILNGRKKMPLPTGIAGPLSLPSGNVAGLIPGGVMPGGSANGILGSIASAVSGGVGQALESANFTIANARMNIGYAQMSGGLGAQGGTAGAGTGFSGEQLIGGLLTGSLFSHGGRAASGGGGNPTGAITA